MENNFQFSIHPVKAGAKQFNGVNNFQSMFNSAMKQ